MMSKSNNESGASLPPMTVSEARVIAFAREFRRAEKAEQGAGSPEELLVLRSARSKARAKFREAVDYLESRAPP